MRKKKDIAGSRIDAAVRAIHQATSHERTPTDRVAVLALLVARVHRALMIELRRQVGDETAVITLLSSALDMHKELTAEEAAES